MQTLPNIDINIKCGNSLISRFDLHNTLTTVKNISVRIKDYKDCVKQYKEGNFVSKQDLERKIDGIKESFKLTLKDEKTKNKLEKAIEAHTTLYGRFLLDNESLLDGLDIGITNNLFNDDIINNLSESQKAEASISIGNIMLLRNKLDSNKESYKNAFEWRFEFPEVLNENGDFLGFDLVIGNPPYISTLDLSKSNTQNKDIYKKNYPNINGSYDIYILFILLGLKLSAKNGCFAWIIPNKFLVAKYAKGTFDMLLEKKLLRLCIDVSNVNTFENASVYPIIILGNNNAKFERFHIETQDDLLLQNFKQVKSIDYDRFKTFANFGLKIQSGLAGFQAHSIIEFLSNDKKVNSISFCVSGNIDRYSINTNKVKYMKHTYKNPQIVPNNFISAEKWNFWSNQKIVIAGMTKKLEACYIKRPLAIGVGVYAIYDFAKLNPLLILGALNSKFMNYVFIHKFQDKHLAGGYLGINKNNLENLPMFEITKQNQKIANEIINLVSEILSLKEKDKDKNTSDLEQQIDELVYKLYNLTDDEIKIVENNN